MKVLISKYKVRGLMHHKYENRMTLDVFIFTFIDLNQRHISKTIWDIGDEITEFWKIYWQQINSQKI